jgi:hypothetical protein
MADNLATAADKLTAVFSITAETSLVCEYPYARHGDYHWNSTEPLARPIAGTTFALALSTTQGTFRV